MLGDGSSFGTEMAGMPFSFGIMVVGPGDASTLKTLIEGTTGADTVTSGIVGAGLGPGRSVFTPSLLDGLSGFQPMSKLTIGRPGRSLTAVGSGKFGLLSLSLLLVAAQMSSPRISRPSLCGNVGITGMTSTDGGIVFWV